MSMASDALGAVGLWMTRRERAQERDDAAIRSVLTAVNSTKLYLAAQKRGDPTDRSAEAQLVELWTTASVHIRRTDEDLALRLQVKAEYWTNPDNWDESETDPNRIRIDKIASDARRLLGPG